MLGGLRNGVQFCCLYIVRKVTYCLVAVNCGHQTLCAILLPAYCNTQLPSLVHLRSQLLLKKRALAHRQLVKNLVAVNCGHQTLRLEVGTLDVQG